MKNNLRIFRNAIFKINQTEELVIALVAILFVLFFSIWGIHNQVKYAIFYNFSFGNMAILSISILFIISISQYFLLRDKAFWYYTLYLACNICYLHATVLFGDHYSKIKQTIPFAILFSRLFLIFTYVLYTLFTIHFLNLEKNYPRLYKHMVLCAWLFFVLFIVRVIEAIHPGESLERAHTILFFCIPVALFGIVNAFMALRGKLGLVFFLGTTFYFVGSILGFLFSTKILTNPFSNQLMHHWTFFTEMGILIESIFFSIGLAYRMRLIEADKYKLEQLVLNNRVRELELQNSIIDQRQQISRDLHDEVNSTLQSVSIYSEIAMKKLESNPKESMTLLASIHTETKTLMQTVHDIVWSLNPLNENLEATIRKMQLFAHEITATKGINLQFHSDIEHADLRMTPTYNKHLYLIFKECMQNILRHAFCNTITICLVEKDHHIQLSIEDDGIGFEKDKTKRGNGMQNMLSRINALNGSMTLYTEANKGTRLVFNFLIGSN